MVAFEAVALPQTVLCLFPDMLVGRLWTVGGHDVYASWVTVGVVAAVAMTALNHVGVRPAAVFQTVATPFLFVGSDVIPQSAEEIDLSFRQIGQLLLVSVAMAVGW